jgi:hypothetical protein
MRAREREVTLSLNPFFMTFDGTSALLGLSNKAAERATPRSC